MFVHQVCQFPLVIIFLKHLYILHCTCTLNISAWTLGKYLNDCNMLVWIFVQCNGHYTVQMDHFVLLQGYAQRLDYSYFGVIKHGCICPCKCSSKQGPCSSRWDLINYVHSRVFAGHLSRKYIISLQPVDYRMYERELFKEQDLETIKPSLPCNKIMFDRLP